MLKHFALISTLMVLGCRANYGGGGGGGYSGGSDYGMGGGGGGGGNYGGDGGGYGHVVPAAVQSHHNIKYYEVPSTGYIQPTTIEVPPNILPVNFIFRSSSSHIHVKQIHDGGKGSHQESHSQDEPHVLRHSVTKPIIQEIKEIISPYRRIKQEIKPVHEEISTVVARGHQQSYGHGYGGGQGGSSYSGQGGQGGY